MNNSLKNFRWAYIGSGSIAESTAKDILKGNHKIVSVYSRNYEKASAFAQKYNATVYNSFTDAISDENVDAVYIATPHTSHVHYSVEAMKAGKPVLCEKPVGVNLKDVNTLVDCAKENKVYFCEAMWTWFSDVALQVKSWIQNGKIGYIKNVTMHYSFPGILMPKTSRVLMPETAGGALLDIGIYPITYCYNLFGYPDEIICRGKVKNGIDISEKITLKYKDFNCNLHISLISAREGCTIKGTAGIIKIPLFHMASKAILKKKNKKEIFKGKTDYLTEFTKVASEIIAGKTESDHIPFSATQNCMKIMDVCRKQMNLKYPFE